MSSEPIRSKLAPFTSAADAYAALEHASDGRDLQLAIDRTVRARFAPADVELLQVAVRARVRALGLDKGDR